MEESSAIEAKKTPSGLKKVQSFKAESETQTSVAMRVPSIKKSHTADLSAISDKLVTEEQTQNASVARRRRMITKNRAQNVRTREKTPEPSRTPLPPHEDTTTTDEEDSKSAKSPDELESEDVYIEMKRKLAEKYSEKDLDDIDIDAIREQQAEEAKERRRRSISPFALPTNEEIANLQRKGSFIDPGNKLLSTTYVLTPKDEIEAGSRKDSLIVGETYRTSSLTPPPSPNSPAKQAPPFVLANPPPPKNKTAATPVSAKTNTLEKTQEANKPLQTQLPTKQINPQHSKPKPCLKAPTNANESNTQKTKEPVQKDKEPTDVPPVRPKRSKSGTRSQGRTSESEMSEGPITYKPKPESPKPPKPKERRRTIAAMKRQVPDKAVAAKRSKSATRPEPPPLDVRGIEITKTSSEIIELLEKARNRAVSIPDEEENISNAVRAYVEKTRQLMTPTKFPSSPRRGSRVTSPKTIEILSDKEVLDTFEKVQRKSMEMERSRHSSGYIDASQSEITSSCYSDSSYSEDDSDFDLTKKSMELSRKLALLQGDKEYLSKTKDAKDGNREKVVKAKEVVKPKGDASKKADVKKVEPKKIESKKIDVKKDEDKNGVKTEESEKVDETPIDPNAAEEVSTFKRMRKHFRPVWKEFRKEHANECTKMRRLWNRCFSDLFILFILCGLGGLVFKYTEGAFENFYKCGVKRVKRDFIDSLWQGSHNMREEDWKSMARNKLWDFETQLHTAHEAGVHSYSGQKAWSFMNSMVYCLTVITTIGYGHIAPSTTTGRAFTILYAIIGIPLFLLLLADFGKLFTRCIKFLWAFVRRLYYTGSCRKVRRTVPVKEVMKGLNKVYNAASTLRRPSQYDIAVVIDENQPPAIPPKPRSISLNLLAVPSDKQESLETETGNEESQTPAPSVFEIDDEFNLPISVAIVVLVAYIIIGASIYVFWEEWGFFESFYFVFISMSTIGFGDFVPNHPMYMMGSIVYLVFGLALTSMCINVVQVKLSDSFRQASAKIGATIGLKVAEEDGSLGAITPPPVEIPAVHGAQKPNENEEPQNQK